MSLLFIQGFEQFKPTSIAENHVLANEIRQYLGFNTPQNTTDWFIDPNGAISNLSGPLIQDSEVNIDGQALVIKRPDAGANNTDFNGTYTMDLTRSIPSYFRSYVGFAMKLSKAPSVPIPLVQFRADSGTANEEQACLWLGTQGQLFFSSVAFDPASTAVQTPTAIAALTSPTQALNFETWNYVEVYADFASSPYPTLTVAVNNLPVINGVQSINGNNSTLTNTSTISILNVPNTYFPGNSYDMFLDDIYFGDGTGNGDEVKNITGPQHIILLQPDTTTTAEWTINGGQATSHESVDGLFDKGAVTEFLTNSGASDEVVMTLGDLPANVVGVSAVQLGAFMSVDAGSTAVNLKAVDGADELAIRKTVNDTDIVFYTGLFEFRADGGLWTVADLNSTSIGLEVTT